MPADPRSPLSAEQLERFRQLLLRRRSELLGDVSQLREEVASSQTEHEVASQADPGAESYERSLSGDLAQRELNLLQTIDHALARIDAGTYGICEVSGEPISLDRLEAKPWARTTIEVARKSESGA